MADFSKDWITLAISGNYWSISDSNLGSASADYYTLLWNLNMESYSSIKLLKQAELAEGVTFSIDSLEERGQFGLAFSMLKNSSTLDIPPSLKNNNLIGVFTGYIFFIASLWQGQKGAVSPAGSVGASAHEVCRGLRRRPAPHGTRFWSGYLTIKNS